MRLFRQKRMKSYKKLREKPDTKEEVYEEHLKIERRCADARATFNRMTAISTPEMLHSSHFLCRNRCSTAFDDNTL